MNPLTRAFISAVIVADLFAVVYFAGSYVLTGHMLPEHETEAKIIVAGAEAPAEADAAPKKDEKPFDLAAYVADPVKGEKIAGKCKACHTFENGGPNRTGPNLFGIVGNHVMHKDDFSYSSAIAAKKPEIGGTWDEAHLFAFLEAPKDYIPGTKMQFNGVKNPAERADLISWLKTLK